MTALPTVSDNFCPLSTTLMMMTDWFYGDSNGDGCDVIGDGDDDGVTFVVKLYDRVFVLQVDSYMQTPAYPHTFASDQR